MKWIVCLIAFLFFVLYLVEKSNCKTLDDSCKYWYTFYEAEHKRRVKAETELEKRKQMYKNLDVMEEEK